ncbi:MAG: alpha/beta fold hydrolase [Candidatus Korobacteraceae bacterium]|jgi:dienelactone hydrolase
MRNAFARYSIPSLLFTLITVSIAPAAERVVDLTAKDGAKLKATYFAAGKPGPGVLLLHQCNRDRKVWNGLAQQLNAAGINVLTLDYRGFGESAGVPHEKATPQQTADLVAKWPGDIDVAYEYLVSQPGVKRDAIGMGGASCGVNNSLQAAIRHPEVRSLVLLSGSANYDGRQYLRRDKTAPVFFAYAVDDPYPPAAFAIQWLYSLTADPGKKLVHYPNGGHGSDIFHAHPELMKAITDWYVTTLIKTPGQAPATNEAAALPPEVYVLDTIDQPGGPAKIQAQLEQARQHDPKATLFDEQLVNLMGYEHMQAGDVKSAIEILKLNAVAYPNSPNVYDSLGDVYLADGQGDLARQNSRKALALLPSDTTDDQQRKDAIKANAEGKLRQLDGEL